jgi:hypothetical protein
VFGIEGKKLLTPQDDYEALKEFNQRYDNVMSPLEAMRLRYRKLLEAHPGLEDELAHFPLRVFSGREHPWPDTRAVFFCYTRPAKDAVTGEWDEQAGDTQWYLYHLETDKVIEDTEQIDEVIRSTPDTPRRRALDDPTLRDIRKKVERHIANTYLKAAQAPAGVKPTLKAWMELN